MIRNWLARLTGKNDATIPRFIWIIIVSFLIINQLAYASKDYKKVTLSATPVNSINSIGSQGEFWIEFRNPYDDAIWHNVKLTGASSHFQVKIIPEIIKELPFTEVDVCIKLKRIKGVTGPGTLILTAEADEFGPTTFLMIPIVEGVNSGTKQGVPIIQIDPMIDVRTYICGFGIIILMVFFIWRKIKLNHNKTT